MKYLDKIREPQKSYSIRNQIFITLGVLMLGICLGTFSKFLDYRHAELPELWRTIESIFDFHNFLGGFAPWIILAVCIAVYSYTPLTASVNVFSFFAGMVSSYYIYCNYVAGFFPRRYAMIWIVFTFFTPLFAYFTWYAKGKGKIAFILSAGIISTLINTTFAYGLFYIDIRSYLNLTMLMVGVFILRKSLKETIGMIGAGAVLAIVFNAIMPFHIW